MLCTVDGVVWLFLTRNAGFSIHCKMHLERSFFHTFYKLGLIGVSLSVSCWYELDNYFVLWSRTFFRKFLQFNIDNNTDLQTKMETEILQNDLFALKRYSVLTSQDG